LVDHGPLQHLGNGVYVITECGENYLAGDIDTAEDSPDGKVDMSNTDNDGTGQPDEV
jgi:hypothetical protein